MISNRKRPADYHYPTLEQLRALKTAARADRSLFKLSEVRHATTRACIRKGFADHEGQLSPIGVSIVERLG